MSGDRFTRLVGDLAAATKKYDQEAADKVRVEEEETMRKRANREIWNQRVNELEAQIGHVNESLVATRWQLGKEPRAQQSGESWLASVRAEVRGEPQPRLKSYGSAVLGKDGNAHLHIIAPTGDRRGSRKLTLDELTGEAWRNWLLDLLEAHKAALDDD